MEENIMTRLVAYIAMIGLLMITFPAISQAQGVITIDLSYKIVLNPADGSRPMNDFNPVTDADIETAVAAMNALSEAYYRGYRFRRAGPVIEVGGLGDTNGPSRWFNTNFFDDGKEEMEAAARSDPRYAWNPNAINLYITNGICGGKCSFPTGDHIIIIGGCSAENGELQLHEIGHYFDLCHTQGCPCGVCDPSQSGQCNTKPGDDNISDTLPDLACWNQDNIANRSYGNNYASLSTGQQNLVDNVFFNIMSYHANRTRLTERQLDRWADTARFFRERVVSGRTFFVQGNGGGLIIGSSSLPFRTVRAGINAAGADGGDIVLIRPGAYDETLTITKPVTLRATRTGPVVIGTTAAPSLSDSQSPQEVEAVLRKMPGISIDDGRQRTDFTGGRKK